MKDYVSLDFETTGLSPETSDIIEIGAWKVQDGVVVDKYCTLVRPVLYIPRTVQDMTGITMDMVADAQTIEPELLEFFDWLGDMPLLGHNLSFDYRFLCYKGKFVGLDFSLGGTRHGIDTMKLSKDYLTLSHNKLEDVVHHFGIDVGSRNGQFHRAGYDAYATKLVYDRFLYSYPNILSVTTPKQLDENDGKYGRATNMDTLSFD